MDVPTQTHRPGGAETVVGTEHGGTVVTQVEIQQVAVVVGISAVEIEAGCMLDVLPITWLATGRVVVGKRWCRKLIVGETGSRIAVGLAGGIVEVEAQHGIDLMLFGYQLTVSGRKVALVIEILLQAVLEESLLGSLLIIEIGMLRREALILGIIILGDTKLGTHAELFGGKPLGDEVVGKAETLALVVVVEMGIPERIRNRIIVQSIFRIIEILVNLAICTILLVVRVGLRIFCETHRRVVGLQIVDGELVAELELSGAVDEVEVSAQGLTVGTLHHAVHLSVVQSQTISHVALATLGIYIVLVGKTGAQRHTEPIGVYALLYVAEAGIIEIIQLNLVERIAGIILIYASQFFELQLLAGIHQVVIRKVGEVHAVVSLVGNLQLTLNRRLGLDDHHAIGRLGTVDGCGCGILEQGNRCHSVHIEVHHSFQGCLETVEDKERLVRVGTIFLLQSRHARLATDFHIRHLVRVGTREGIVHDLERRVQGLQALEHVLCAHALEFIALEGSRRTGEALLLASIDTGNHHILDILSFRLQHDSGKVGLVVTCISDYRFFIADK